MVCKINYLKNVKGELRPWSEYQLYVYFSCFEFLYFTEGVQVYWSQIQILWNSKDSRSRSNELSPELTLYGCQVRTKGKDSNLEPSLIPIPHQSTWVLCLTFLSDSVIMITLSPVFTIRLSVFNVVDEKKHGYRGREIIYSCQRFIFTYLEMTRNQYKVQVSYFSSTPTTSTSSGVPPST